MTDIERADNVYLIATKAPGLYLTNCAYLVAGREIALIDTGPATAIESVRAGIRAHGFSISDIAYIFVTHEHEDHFGNVAPILREAPRAKVYTHPLASEYLTSPANARAVTRGPLPEKIATRFGKGEPIPSSRLERLHDGDAFDLGNGEKLRVIFAPGHQPGGIVILAERTMGLFINDLVGANFADAGASFMLTPPGSDIVKIKEALKKFMDMPLKWLFLGHAGIWDNPGEVLQRASDKIQWLLDMGASCMEEGKPEEIAGRFVARVMPELEKIKAARGEGLYRYYAEGLLPHLSGNFAKYYQGLWKKQSKNRHCSRQGKD